MKSVLLVEFKAAVALEQKAWIALDGRLPGTPHHDAAAWNAWRSAARRCDEIRSQLPRYWPVPEGNTETPAQTHARVGQEVRVDDATQVAVARMRAMTEARPAAADSDGPTLTGHRSGEGTESIIRNLQAAALRSRNREAGQE